MAFFKLHDEMAAANMFSPRTGLKTILVCPFSVSLSIDLENEELVMNIKTKDSSGPLGKDRMLSSEKWKYLPRDIGHFGIFPEYYQVSDSLQANKTSCVLGCNC